MPELFSSPQPHQYGPTGQGRTPPPLHFPHLTPCRGSTLPADSHSHSPLLPAEGSQGLQPSDGPYGGDDSAERTAHVAETRGCPLCSSVMEKGQLKISPGSNCTGGGSPFLPCETWGLCRQHRSKDHGVTCHPKYSKSSPQFHGREAPALTSVSPAQGRSALPTAASQTPFQEPLTASILSEFFGHNSERNMQPPRLHNTITLRQLITRHLSKTVFPKAVEGLLHL